ncbi:MAG: zinc ribbon domain-containing protein [Gammaproteobacteria bacterium]|nr:MAG: zinc ribbon domain-containing protein [Gammaproteobacteria bacterium]
MPIYEYRCEACGVISSVFSPLSELEKTIKCDSCGAVAHRIVSRPSVHLSKASKLERLDPKYDKMVDHEMKSTQQADPDWYLKRMRIPKDSK